jgi:hypothetical protein
MAVSASGSIHATAIAADWSGISEFDSNFGLAVSASVIAEGIFFGPFPS